MKQITLNVTNRSDLGRTAARHLRQNGVIPAVVYGESGNRNLSLNMHDFKLAYREFSGRASLLELKPEGEGETIYAIIQELQRDSRNDAFVHVDFKEIVRGRDMEAEVPVKTRGTPDGVRNYGGVLEVSAQTLRIRCRPRNLPEAIVVDVADLQIGRAIHLHEVPVPEGVIFLEESDLVVAACVGASAAEPETEEEDEEGVEGKIEKEADDKSDD